MTSSRFSIQHDYPGGCFSAERRNNNDFLRPATTYCIYVLLHIPICSMYGIFTNICPKNHLNVGKYTIHGVDGIYLCLDLPGMRFFFALLLKGKTNKTTRFFPNSLCENHETKTALTKLLRHVLIYPNYLNNYMDS